MYTLCQILTKIEVCFFLMHWWAKNYPAVNRLISFFHASNILCHVTLITHSLFLTFAWIWKNAINATQNYWLFWKHLRPTMVYTSVTQVYQKSRTQLKMLGARRVTWNKLYTQEPQVLGATLQNLVAWVKWVCHFCISALHPYQSHI